MKKYLEKLRSRAGETLVEAMAAILVFTLASVLLFTMVNAASRINKQVRDEDLALSDELNFAERKKQGIVNDTASIRVIIDGKAADRSFPVKIFREKEGALYSYSLAPAASESAD